MGDILGKFMHSLSGGGSAPAAPVGSAGGVPPMAVPSAPGAASGGFAGAAAHALPSIPGGVVGNRAPGEHTFSGALGQALHGTSQPGNRQPGVHAPAYPWSVRGAAEH